jgi:hypothetical protein
VLRKCNTLIGVILARFGEAIVVHAQSKAASRKEKDPSEGTL